MAPFDAGWLEILEGNRARVMAPSKDEFAADEVEVALGCCHAVVAAHVCSGCVNGCTSCVVSGRLTKLMPSAAAKVAVIERSCSSLWCRLVLACGFAGVAEALGLCTR